MPCPSCMLLRYRFLVPVALVVGCFPFYPEPHLTRDLLLLAAHAPPRPIDIIDLFWHAWPLVLLGLQVGVDLGAIITRRQRDMKRKGSSDTPLVWSSEVGRICPGCGKAAASCTCRTLSRAAAPDGDGVVRVQRESKGRGGKTVTVVTGLPGEEATVKAVAAELKRRCGSGGTVKERVIEIQGDHRDAIVADLEGRGLRVKRVGG